MSKEPGSSAADPETPTQQILIRRAQGRRIEVSYSGDRTTGEGNRSEIAQTVIHFLNEWGEAWGPLQDPGDMDPSADAVAEGPTGKLRLQITRMPWAPEYWARIGRVGHASSVQTPDEAAADLIATIRAKAARYSSSDRASLVLVLDGSRTAAYDLPPTLAVFHERYLEDARQAGFEDIFLVGLVRFINLLNPPVGPEWFSVA